MSALESFEAQSRDVTGSGPARATRREGMIPGIVYGDSKAPQSITTELKPIAMALHTPGFFSRVFKLNVDKKSVDVIVKDIQLHPVSDEPRHIDFQRVNKKSKVVVSIPVNFINHEKSPALKRGGKLNVVSHGLAIKCSPSDIPEALTIDLTGLEAGHSIRLKGLELPKGVTPMTKDPSGVLATIAAPKGAKAAVEETTEE